MGESDGQNYLCPFCGYKPKVKRSLTSGVNQVELYAGRYSCGRGFNSCSVIAALNKTLELHEKIRRLESDASSLKGDGK